MPKLLLATNNPGKLAEFRVLLADCGWELGTPQELKIEIPTGESGVTYKDNAKIKALSGASASGLVTVADDSGLEIDALAGAPGPQSARFLGEEASYRERFVEILKRLQGLPSEKRGARFRCVIAIAEAGNGKVHFLEGCCDGQIAEAPRGEGGFGYDPIFLLPQFGKTFAELSAQEKNAISHRGQAARAAAGLLREMTNA